MNFLKTFPKRWVLCWAAIALGSCTATPPVSEAPTPTQSVPFASPTAPNATSSTIAVQVYQPDSQCLALVPKPVAVATSTPVKSAIGEIIAELSSPEFQVAEYEVAVKNRQATVDLQLAPGSTRQLNSLSACEQMALFAGIEKTLTSNPEWQIQSVQFTEGGRALVF
jgi:hypothetical protein